MVERMGVTALGLTLLSGGPSQWRPSNLARLKAAHTLFAPDRIIDNFCHMDRAFFSVPLDTAPQPHRLARAAPVALPWGTESWIRDRTVTSLVVLSQGQITHESYHLGTKPHDLRISWSVAKSFLSLLTGILIKQGYLNLTDQVATHCKILSQTAYDGATVEDLLQMESGVAFDEDYLDAKSDINRMGRELALGGTLDGFATKLCLRARDPGEAMQYVSMDTHVLGMVLRSATGKSVPDLLSEHLLIPAGIEGPAYYLTDGAGEAFVLGGLNMTTRDFARLGLIVARDGAPWGPQIVPADWIARSTTPSAKTAPPEMGYGYQWWIPTDARVGEVLARGIYGQYIYIDRQRDIVIATNGADRRFREPGRHEANIDRFRAIADAQPQAH